MSEAIMKEIAELKRKLRDVVRWGVVDSVDSDGGTVVIQYQSGPKSRAMPWVGSNSGFTAEPSPGDQALVLAPDGEPANAAALCGAASTDATKGNKTGATREDRVKAELDDIRQKFDNHIHTTTATVGTGSVGTISAPTAPMGDAGDVGANKVRVD